MARIFTTPFDFNGQIYHAFVTVKKHDSQLDLIVNLNDLSLQEFIPDGTFDYDSESGCKQKELLENEIARKIIDCVMRSIHQHMEKHMAV